MPTIEELQFRFTLDRAVKQSLQSHADNELSVHRIEHHFMAGARESLENLAAFATELSFTHSSVSEGVHQEKAYWYFDVLSDRDTKTPGITRESILMLSLAEAFGVAYDGWGTLIEADE